MTDTEQTPSVQDDDFEPISYAEARAIIDAAIRERLGDDWENEHDGWTRIDGHDYMVRLNRGRKNLDFYVDLLGNVRVEESEINPAQENGRLLALTFLISSLILAVILARVSGFL